MIRIRKRVIVALFVLGMPIIMLGVWTGMMQARDGMRRQRARENLRRIGIALENYHLRHPEINVEDYPDNGEDDETDSETIESKPAGVDEPNADF